MRVVTLGGGMLAACCFAGTANAEFLGWAGDSYAVTVGGTNYAVINVYAMYSKQGWNGEAIAGGDRFLNVYSSNITLTGATNFYQQNATWDPVAGTNAADSKCATGGQVGNCITDPNFLNWDDSNGEDPTLPPSADGGWAVIQSNPADGNNYARTFTTQGTFTNDTGSNFGVFIGRFTLKDVVGVRTLNFKANIASSKVGESGVDNSSDNETFTYVPAPGAVVLLGVSVLASRRRRNRSTSSIA